MKNNLCVHIFRRDLRLEDNTSLINSLKDFKNVIPVFILDKKILTSKYSENAFQFMLDCIRDLNLELEKKGSKLYLFHDYVENVIKKLIKLDIQKISVNKDYTPYALKRDDIISDICKQKEIDFEKHSDLLLNEPEEILKDDGRPYIVFSHFLKKSKEKKVDEPKENNFKNYFKDDIDQLEISYLEKFKKNHFIKGGRNQALKLIERLKEIKYSENRNFPFLQATTNLSPHNKNGTLSIREVYYAFEKNGDIKLLNELYWRDFFIHIGYHFPYVFKHAFKQKYEKILWRSDQQKFNRWCEGKTGFPIVDAGMRELNQTGFMHNRVRMITASFLVKILGIDWKFGERYFASKLVDYDPSINNGNWQWIASTGCDSQPFFRIFNPWIQQKKYDPECIYIKEWIPELKGYSPKEIHDIEKNNLNDKKYPNPIVDYKKSVENILKMYKKYLN